MKDFLFPKEIERKEMNHTGKLCTINTLWTAMRNNYKE